jgi:N-acetylglutamate synthase-like GNAT family acetyltransferase
LELLGAGRLDDVFDLCRRCLPEPPTREELSSSLYSPEQAVTVRGDPAIGIVATACSGDQGYIRLLGVEPTVRGRGHGVALLRSAEADLSDHGATSVQVGADPPYYLYPGVQTTQTAMLSLLERHRYQRAESNFNMGVDLDALPPDPGGHELAAPGERPEIAAWMRMHWPNWEAEALRALEHSTLVISRDHDGIAAFCAYDVNRSGLLGPIAVRGDLWGRGVGRPLLIGALHRMRAAGRHRIEIAWVGPIRPYAHVGARVSRVFFVYRRTLSSR